MKVARAMEKFCAERGCHLGLMLGDNFHPTGVRSVDDPQFIEKFEKPFKNSLLFGWRGLDVVWVSSIDPKVIKNLVR
jgi:hypothetical protein